LIIHATQSEPPHQPGATIDIRVRPPRPLDRGVVTVQVVLHTGRWMARLWTYAERRGGPKPEVLWQCAPRTDPEEARDVVSHIAAARVLRILSEVAQ
jgi:hypothetical protein